jgi:hypothetical protein
MTHLCEFAQEGVGPNRCVEDEFRPDGRCDGLPLIPMHLGPEGVAAKGNFFEWYGNFSIDSG